MQVLLKRYFIQNIKIYTTLISKIQSEIMNIDFTLKFT